MTRDHPIQLFVAAALLAAAPLLAAEEPGKGKLLVATEQVRGPIFAETVILLLLHDETGTMGLIVNRKTETSAGQALPEADLVRRYSGKLYFGGPVDRSTIRALLRSDDPPADAVPIVDNVYLAPIEDGSPGHSQDEATLRFFIGYAGWSPGQLDAEMLSGSWHVMPANSDVVFTDDPARLWRQLSPPDTLRVFVERAPP